jgi:acetylglutamate kinase
VVYLTDVEGLRRDASEPASLIRTTTPSELRSLLDTGAVEGGMIPKVAACVHAVEHGVASAHILDGTVPHVVLLELFSDAGIGTMITPEASA